MAFRNIDAPAKTVSEASAMMLPITGRTVEIVVFRALVVTASVVPEMTPVRDR
jgi:hypothetical protein